MAAPAPNFDACGARVAHHPTKGRVVVSDRAFAPGDVIFRERAFVSASWNTDLCGSCEEPRSDGSRLCACDRGAPPQPMYSSKLQASIGRRNVVVGVMSSIDGIAEVDRARCVLKCLAMVESDPHALDEVLSLSWAGQDRALQAATQLRRQVPEIFPAGFSDLQMATLLGVLNTNSHELEHVGGSGLFLAACRMEHDCAPNCSFTTFGDTLWMTAIRPVAPGDALSIDYGNFFYRPTHERQTSLFESYGFVCHCDTCIRQPDASRAFQCPACAGGVVLPVPTPPAGPLAAPEALQFEFGCSGCGRASTPEDRARYVQAENELLEMGFPQSLEEVDAVVAQGALHERHYLLFWALDTIGCEAAELNAFLTDAEHRQALAQVWERIIALMNVVVLGVHHEKTIYYDNLAQVQVVLGNEAAARAAYAKAVEVASIVSGRDCEPTRKLVKLMENPPRDAIELRRVYDEDAKLRRRPDRDDDEDAMADDP